MSLSKVPGNVPYFVHEYFNMNENNEIADFKLFT